MRKLMLMLAVTALLAVGVPLTSAQMSDALQVELAPTGLADGAGLAGVTGYAHVESGNGFIHIVLMPNGAALPDGAVLEGWIVDAGLDGGPGTTNVSDADEAFGAPFGDEMLNQAISSAPYALSTGVLTATEDGTWEASFHLEFYTFSPYDAVVVTLESDGLSPMGFDPRPGAPVFSGSIADGTPADPMGMTSMDDSASDDMGSDDMSGETMDDSASDDMGSDDMSGETMDDSMSDDDMGSDDMSGETMDDSASDDMSGDDMSGETMDDSASDDMSGDDMGMMAGTHVALEASPLAADAGLADAVGDAFVYSDSATIDIAVSLNGAAVPDGAVLEGWIVDGAVFGVGMNDASDADEAFGTAFDNADFKAAVESAPYALSTGVLTAADDGTLSLHFTIPAYNFSPYDVIMITVESDGNADGFDPRPGTPVLIGSLGGM